MNFNDFGNKLIRYGKGFEKAFNDATLQAANELKGNIEYRVFDDTKGIDGQPIGNYKSEAYKKRRLKKKLQIGTVDLQFHKDLLGGIDLGTRDGDNVVEFGDEFSMKKGRYNEKRFRGEENTIFASSKPETEVTIETIEEEMTKYLNSIFK
ncbi:MAG: hypothetical protein GY756_26895 [bacterium]|nr:hypothetical protein [bacterium]